MCAQVGERIIRTPRYGNDGAAGRLREEEYERVDAVGHADVRADVAVQARLDKRGRQAAVREVVCRLDQSVARGLDQDIREQPFPVKIDSGRLATEEVVHRLHPLGTAELVACVAQQEDLRS